MKLFLNENEDFQISYQLVVGEEWHSEAAERNVHINRCRIYVERQQYVKPKMEESILV